MLKQDLVAYAKKIGLHKIGFASVSKYKNVLPQWNPLSILPSAKTVIVFLREIPRGVFRGVEQGGLWIRAPRQLQPYYGYNICRYLEDQGILAVPCSPLAEERWPDGAVFEDGIVAPNVTPSLMYAATIAGLGEVGLNGLFLTPEYGLRQSLGMCFTEAEFEPDPPLSDPICPRNDCKKCIDECPLSALSDDYLMIDYGNGNIPVANINTKLCHLCRNGMFPDTSYSKAAPNRLCASCARACISCLEAKLSKKYFTPFREDKWQLGLFDE